MERKRYEQRDAAQWRKHIAAQQQSAQSVAEYCRAAGVSESGLYQWRKRLEPARPSAGFERIDADAKLGTAVIITTPNGYQVQSESVDAGIAVAQRLAQC